MTNSYCGLIESYLDIYLDRYLDIYLDWYLDIYLDWYLDIYLDRYLIDILFRQIFCYFGAVMIAMAVYKFVIGLINILLIYFD